MPRAVALVRIPPSANLRILELIITALGGFFERESTDTDHRIEVVTPDALVFKQSGYSPSTIAAEVAGLVAAAALGETNGDRASAQRYRAKADEVKRGSHRLNPYCGG